MPEFLDGKARKRYVQEPPPDKTRAIIVIGGGIALLIGAIILFLIN